MGYYIETPYPTKKFKQLSDLSSFKIELEPYFDPTGNRVGVCVVENGPFDAAAIVFSKNERDAFCWSGDHRPKQWCSLDREEVVKLCPHVEKMLPPKI